MEWILIHITFLFAFKSCSGFTRRILFNTSVLESITLGKKREVKVIEAAKKVGVHDFISQLDGSYEFQLKRGGVLSSGQRQLISF